MNDIEGSADVNAADGSDGNRPEVEITHDESQVAVKVIAALGNLGWQPQSQSQELQTFQRAGVMVQVVTDATPVAEIKMPDDARRLRPLPASLVRERITIAVRLYSVVKTENGSRRKTERPPRWLVAAIHERGQYPPGVIRPIIGIVSAPTMRPDGSVIQASGYDAATGLLVELSGDWPTIPDRPTRDDAIKAVRDLLEVVRDFPFSGPAHRMGWLSLVLTLVGRPAIPGCCPLFLIEARAAGSGKGLLANVAGIIATGRALPVKSYPGSDTELNKVITAVALEALSVVLLDNIAGQLGCPALDAAMTATSWSDRILGTSKTTGTLPLTTVWMATGNNVELVGDTARRTLLIRLESPLENPEERSDFAHPDLLTWVRHERRRLATAALTILRAYVVAGRPDQGLAPWGSFEAWSALVRSAIVWTGHPDPAETRATVREADRSAELLRLVLNGVAEADAGQGVTAADIGRLLEHQTPPDEPDPYPTLRAAVSELCGAKFDARKLGIELRKFSGRICGGRRLERMTDSHNKVARWRVEVCGDVRGPAGIFSTNLAHENETPLIHDPHTNMKLERV